MILRLSMRTAVPSHFGGGRGCPGSHSGICGVFRGSEAGYVAYLTNGWKVHAPGHAAADPQARLLGGCHSLFFPPASVPHLVGVGQKRRKREAIVRAPVGRYLSLTPSVVVFDPM